MSGGSEGRKRGRNDIFTEPSAPKCIITGGEKNETANVQLKKQTTGGQWLSGIKTKQIVQQQRAPARNTQTASGPNKHEPLPVA